LGAFIGGEAIVPGAARQPHPLTHAERGRTLTLVQNQLAYAICPAGPGDALDLARVHVAAWRETYPGLLPKSYLDAMSVQRHARQWRRRLMGTREVTLAAEGAGGLVGYCSGGQKGREDGLAEITTLYILRQAQDAGLGRRLLTDTARVLAARGALSLVIWVLRDNTKARGFYEHLGGKLDAARGEMVGGRVIPSVAYRWERLGRGGVAG
jgi:ribosomal protein S18 acetylase RimI-like enzyme